MENQELKEKVFIELGKTITNLQAKRANYFLGKSDLLFALCIDNPDLYKIPLYLFESVKTELKRLGWLVDRRSIDEKMNTYRTFYLGPRVRRASSTKKKDATSFKLYFYSTPWNR